MSRPKAHLILATATALLASAPAVRAAANDYYIHFTENPKTAGFITAGDPNGPPLVPPAGACGMRYTSIDDSEWILPNNLDGPTIPPGPLNIYIGLSGCGWNGVTIDPDNPGSGPKQIAPLQGFAGSFHVYAKGKWIDGNGNPLNQGCGSCGIPAFPAYAGSGSYWLVLPARLAALKSTLSGKPDIRSLDRLFTLIDGDLSSLSKTVANGIARRRTIPLGILDASVRSLEDDAQKRLGSAARQTSDCRTLRARGDLKSAFMACDAASNSVNLTRALLTTAESWFE